MLSLNVYFLVLEYSKLLRRIKVVLLPYAYSTNNTYSRKGTQCLLKKKGRRKGRRREEERMKGKQEEKKEEIYFFFDEQKLSF